MMPVRSSFRIRSRMAEGASPTRRAISEFGVRAFSWRMARIARSSGSSIGLSPFEQNIILYYGCYKDNSSVLGRLDGRPGFPVLGGQPERRLLERARFRAWGRYPHDVRAPACHDARRRPPDVGDRRPLLQEADPTDP